VRDVEDTEEYEHHLGSNNLLSKQQQRPMS